MEPAFYTALCTCFYGSVSIDSGMALELITIVKCAIKCLL